MKKINDYIGNVITKLENNLKGHSILKLLIVAYSFTLIRNFLESSFEEAARIGFTNMPFISLITYFYHYPVFYFNVYFFVAIILSVGKAYKYKDALKLSLFFAFWVILAPFFDLFLGGHFDINYIMSVKEFPFYFINSLNPFIKAPGITTGIRIESALAIIALFIVLTYKNRKILTNILLILIFYTFLLLIGGTLQALYCELFGYTFNGGFNSPGLIFYPALRMGVFLFIILVIEIILGLFISSPKRFRKYVTLVRWERILFYLSVVTMGFLIGFKTMAFGYPLMFRNPTDYLAIISLIGHTFFGFLFGLTINDYYDKKGDLLAGQKTPLTMRIIRKQEVPYLALFFFLSSIIFAFSISYYTFLIALSALTLSYIYSAPPFRLKKYWPLSIFTITTIAFLETVVGASVFARYAAINILPKEVFYVFFLILPLAFGTKDLKDYTGDKETGVFTIFTWLGLEKGCIINALLVFIAFMLVPVIYGFKFLFISLLLGLPVALYIAFYPKLKQSRPRELIFFSVLIFYILYMGKSTVDRVSPPVDLQKLMRELNIKKYALYPANHIEEKFIFDAIMDKKDSLYYLLQAKNYVNEEPLLSFYYLNRLLRFMKEKQKPQFFDPKFYYDIKKRALEQLIKADSLDLAISYAIDGLSSGVLSDDFYYLLGETLMDKNRYKGALLALKGAYFLHPSARSAKDLAFTYKALGLQDSFIKYFDEYLKYKPK